MEDFSVTMSANPNSQTMEKVLDLQALEVQEDDNIFGNSCSSSDINCCNK